MCAEKVLTDKTKFRRHLDDLDDSICINITLLDTTKRGARRSYMEPAQLELFGAAAARAPMFLLISAKW